jgi:adenylate kinase family enzyme
VQFGARIMICGTSNTGKSTLAGAIGRKIGVRVVHLDLLRLKPHTDWVQRPDEEFRELHDGATLGESWVMEGNYSALMPQRLARATGIILLADSRFANFGRYLRRTLFQHDRIGALDGNRDSVKWEMVKWVLVGGPRSARRYHDTLPATGRPYLEVQGMSTLKRLHADWGLTR